MAKKSAPQSKATAVSKKPAKGTKAPSKARQTKTASPRGRAKAAAEGNLTIVENEPATVETFGDAPKATPVLKHASKSKKAKPAAAVTAPAPAESSEKKLSCIAAALKVLGESSEPLNTQQMIATMGEKGYWTSPGGKTPHATLYSAILREITTKGDASRFVKTDRGLFAVRAGV